MMPSEVDPGRPFPWRKEAAELALVIAREVQARKAEGDYFSEKEDQLAFETALYGAPDLPDAVAAFGLELAERREAAPEIRERAERARQKAVVEQRAWQEAHPERAIAVEELCSPVLPFGPLRDPWPDGPRSRVSEAFQHACLETFAFPFLAKTRPSEALEVLLAVCIEEPQHEDPYGYSLHENCGVDHWHGGYPPLYFRGPFLSFLREAPDQGLSFVLRLVNFATRRCTETEPRRLARLGMTDAQPDIGIDVTIDGKLMRWLGDARVFKWHNSYPHDAHVIPCALMALERWLYEQIDQGADIEPWLRRILAESESIAFAGLLIEIGKRKPELFSGILQPLLRVWELYNIDVAATMERSTMNPGLFGWGMQPAKLAALARDWFGMPHRKTKVVEIAIRIMLSYEELRPFFSEVRADWTSKLDEQGKPDRLRFLIERLDPQNYTARRQDENTVLIEFSFPDEIQQRNDADLRQLDEDMRLMTYSFQCRQQLDKGTPIPSDQVLPFWDSLQRYSNIPAPQADEMGYSAWRRADIVCGGIAVLLVFHRNWLLEDATRMAWCRQQLASTIQQPPPWTLFDSDTAAGNDRWDAFASECGVALLAENQDDELARVLVACGVVGYRYSTTALTMSRAYRCRDRLGDDFDRLINLSIQWAGIRSLHERANQLQFKSERFFKAEDDLIKGFISRESLVPRPTLKEIDKEAMVDLEADHAEHFPDHKMSWWKKSRHDKADNEPVRPRLPGLDLQVLASAFSWLDLRTARSAAERKTCLELIRELLQFSLSLLPERDEADPPEIDGLPNGYDDWAFGMVARALPEMTPAEDPDSLWQSILNLGTPAHEWVERFFWYWFTDGAKAAQSPQVFTSLWTRMISFALHHPGWDPQGTATNDLDDMVFELLGFHFSLNAIVDDTSFAKPIGSMADILEHAAKQWLGMRRVANGLAQFIVRPAGARLLVPGMQWLSTAFRSFTPYDYRKSDFEENLVAVLGACWEREQPQIAGDPNAREAFQSLLTSLAARGGHAAIALRDRVLDSINATV